MTLNGQKTFHPDEEKRIHKTEWERKKEYYERKKLEKLNKQINKHYLRKTLEKLNKEFPGFSESNI